MYAYSSLCTKCKGKYCRLLQTHRQLSEKITIRYGLTHVARIRCRDVFFRPFYFFLPCDHVDSDDKPSFSSGNTWCGHYNIAVHTYVVCSNILDCCAIHRLRSTLGQSFQDLFAPKRIRRRIWADQHSPESSLRRYDFVWSTAHRRLLPSTGRRDTEIVTR